MIKRRLASCLNRTNCLRKKIVEISGHDTITKMLGAQFWVLKIITKFESSSSSSLPQNLCYSRIVETVNSQLSQT